MTQTQIVLVPGFWLGAWAWDDVVPYLRDRGHDVLALTLPGLDPANSRRGEVTLEDHAEAILAALDPDAERRVLVVHSGAAVPGTMVLDRAADLVDHVVFVDTAPVRDGFALAPTVQGDEHPLSAAWDEQVESGSLRELTDDQLTTLRERAVPQPAQTVRGTATLTNPQRLDVPGTVICTSFPSADFLAYAAQGADFLAGLNDHQHLRFVDLPTGHWPMWSRPAQLAELIADAADQGGAGGPG